MKYWFTLSLGLLGSIASYGQLHITAGPRVGLGAATAKYGAVRESFATKPVIGGEVGGMINLGWQHWAGQASALYAQKGFRLDDAFAYPPGSGLLSARYDEAYRLHYLTVPVNVAYRLRADGQGLQVFAGGYVGRLLGGRNRFDNDFVFETDTDPAPVHYEGSSRVKTTNQYSAEKGISLTSNGPIYLRPWDLGVQAGVGYQHQRMLLQLSYSRGLSDLGPRPATDTDAYRKYGSRVFGPTYKLRGLQLSASYLLGKQ